MRELLEYSMIGFLVLAVIMTYNHIRARRAYLKKLERKKRSMGIRTTKGIK
jgi:hypothetical protein